MQRIDILRALGNLTTTEDVFVASQGAVWHDWWNCRPGSPDLDNTFWPGTLGSICSTALGLALALPHRRVIALDNDGSVLMNTGVLATLGAERTPNLTVIVSDNGIYESIGGLPTLTSINTDLAKMAEGAGCINAVTVTNINEFNETAERLLNDDECGFLVAKIEPGVQKWPKDKRRNIYDGVEDKFRFMRFIEKLEGIVLRDESPQD